MSFLERFRKSSQPPPLDTRRTDAEAATRHQASDDQRLGNLARAAGRLDEAEVHYRAALTLDATLIGAWLGLGLVLLDTGRPAEALDAFTDSHALAPGRVDPLFFMGLCHEALGDLENAEHSWREGLQIEADFVPALERLVPLLLERDGAAAENAVRAAIDKSPERGGLHLMLALVLEKQGQSDGALAALDASVQCDPGLVGAHARRAALVNNRGMAERASAASAAFLAAAQDHPLAHYEAARAAILCGNFELATTHADRAADIDRTDADALFVGGYACLQLLRTTDALQHFAAAKRANPNHVRAAWAYANAQVPAVYRLEDDADLMIDNLDRELEALDLWFDATRIQSGHDALGTVHAFYLAYQERDNRQRLSRYGKLCHRLMLDWQDRQGIVALPKRHEGPIRIALVSHFISNHSVWHALTKGWLQHIDATRFEVHLFALEQKVDEETAHARSMCHSLTQGSFDLLGWCKAIQAKGVEAIIYPDIGMGPISLMLAAMRLAPVQIASWGHPETTGLPTIDYYLSADDLEPDDATRYYSETLVRLPHLGCSYASLAVTPSTAQLEKWGIKRDRAILLCPGVPFKYAPQNDHVLVDICMRLGRCQLVFFAHGVGNCNSRALQERLARRFLDAGLDIADFVVTAPWLDQAAFHGLMESSTLFLDTIGFSGFNTAMQAIESSLPVVTREGRFMRGRLASGILKRLGLFELITADNAEYVERVVQLVNHPAMLDALRARIRSGRAVLFDDPAPIRALEQFLSDTTR